MTTGCDNWTQAVSRVLLTDEPYLHEKVTIEKRDGEKSIALLTPGKTQRFIPDEAVKYLEEHFEF